MTARVHLPLPPPADKSQFRIQLPRGRVSKRSGFWIVAAAFFTLTAFSTVPSPLYGIYAQRDGLSSIIITVVYAVYAVGTIASLLFAGHISDWYGRRPVLIPALLIATLAAVAFALSTSLPGLVVGRVLTGLALGAGIATSTAHLTDLDLAPLGKASRRAQIVSTVANIGGLATGPVLSGLLGEYLPDDTPLPYLVFAALLAAAALGVAVVPETRPPLRPRPRYRPQRPAASSGGRTQFVAAITGIFLAFAAAGLFTGLSAAFLAGALHDPSPFLAGLAIFITFGCGVLTQVSTMSWPIQRLIAAGVPLFIAGLGTVVAGAWVAPPSLALFLAGGAVTGVGTGAVFRGTLTITVSAASGETRAAALATFFTAGYAGLSLPIVGVGVALQYVSFKVALLAFAALVVAGTLAALPVLLTAGESGRRPRRSPSADIERDARYRGTPASADD
jgi:MFS family permease